MYIVRSKSCDIYVSVEPVLNIENENQFPVCFAWTYEKAEAVRFPTKWHAKAVAKALPSRAVVIRVKP